MIEHLKSGLSVSTHVGCPMGCEYCVLSVMDAFRRVPEQDETPEEIVETLLLGKTLFADGLTPLMINNRTDPWLPGVRESSLRLLELLAENKVSSPVLIISKFAPDERIRGLFSRLNILYLYSYSGCRKDFNYHNVSRDIERICEAVPFDSRFHYMRPVIPGMNDDPDQILGIMHRFEEAGFRGSVVAGLRVHKNNVNLLEEGSVYDSQHKLLSSEVFPDLIQRLQHAGSRYQVYRHTSCAICSFMGYANRLGYYERSGHCSPLCASRESCAVKTAPDNASAAAFIQKYLPGLQNWEYQAGTLKIRQAVNQETVAFIRNALGIGVDADCVLLSASERAITNE